MAQYGSFPGVQVTTERGGVSSVSVGSEEKLVLFGEANYDSSNLVEGDNTELDVSASEPEQINATGVADDKFGSDSELADAMKEALQNGANIEYLYGVAVPRSGVQAEEHSAQEGTLDNVELVEDVDQIAADDDGTSLTVEFRYSSPPEVPGDADTIYINPLTGEYAIDTTPTGFSIDYVYNDYTSAFEADAVKNVINEGETGVFFALSDSDSVSSSLDAVVNPLRKDYQLVTGFTFAEPNTNELLDSGADARYNTDTYDSANQSVSAPYFYKFAPAREQDVAKTIGGGLAGVFAGNPISDPIYNEVVSGYQDLEQQFSKSQADDMRKESIIPVRSGGSIRVKSNRSTAYAESDVVGADFWTRRITDRVILISKLVGDAMLGRVNDEDTRGATERELRAQMRSLSRDRLIRPNGTDEKNWSVEVYEDPTDNDEVKIDVTFTPYGIVKRVDETIRVDTN